MACRRQRVQCGAASLRQRIGTIVLGDRYHLFTRPVDVGSRNTISVLNLRTQSYGERRFVKHGRARAANFRFLVRMVRTEHWGKRELNVFDAATAVTV